MFKELSIQKNHNFKLDLEQSEQRKLINSIYTQILTGDTRIRNSQNAIGQALRRGRQYLRETSVNGSSFSLPDAEGIIPWSRILFNQEVLVILNSNGIASQEAEITVDKFLHPVGSQMNVLYRSDWSDAELKNSPSHQTGEVTANQSRVTVRIQLPPAGMAILA